MLAQCIILMLCLQEDTMLTLKCPIVTISSEAWCNRMVLTWTLAWIRWTTLTAWINWTTIPNSSRTCPSTLRCTFFRIQIWLMQLHTWVITTLSTMFTITMSAWTKMKWSTNSSINIVWCKWIRIRIKVITTTAKITEIITSNNSSSSNSSNSSRIHTIWTTSSSSQWININNSNSSLTKETQISNSMLKMLISTNNWCRQVVRPKTHSTNHKIIAHQICKHKWWTEIKNSELLKNLYYNLWPGN